MKISRVSVYRVELPVTGQGFKFSGGRVVRSTDSTIVRIDTDEGVSGWGETCPFGNDYLPAFPEGARAALGLLAPALLGRDPRRPNETSAVLDRALMGHGYVKSALDMACWDVTGRALDRPLAELLGGWVTEALPAISGIAPGVGDDPAAAVERFRAQGLAQVSIKASGDPAADIALLRGYAALLAPGESLRLDANRGWRVDQAIRVVRAAGDLDLVVEQPCDSLADCVAVKRATGCVLILDECVTDARDLVEAKAAGALDGLNIKIGRVGGLTQSRLLRDLCLELDVPLYIQDTGGSSIVQAAIAHLGHATPASHLLAVWDPHGITETRTAEHAPVVAEGRMRAPKRPGLGVEPIAGVLGEPAAVYA